MWLAFSTLSYSFFPAVFATAYFVDPLFALSIICVPFFLKAIFQSKRPSVGFYRGPDRYGFPSGHAFFAGVLASMYPQPWSLAYAVALSASRVLLNAHTIQDVVGGLMFGFAYGTFYPYTPKPLVLLLCAAMVPAWVFDIQ